MTALARRLRSRGNEVVFLGVPDAEPFVRAANLRFLPYGEDRYPPGSTARITAPVARLSGLEVLEYTVEKISPGLLEAALRDLPGKLEEAGIEGLVIDNAYFFAQLVPMSLDLPFVQIWAILPSHPSGAAPPAFASWPHGTSPEALARNAEGLKKYHAFLTPSVPIAQAFAGEVGLEIDWADPGATTSRLAVIAQTPEVFDYPGIPWPATFHYAGPFHDDGGRVPMPFAWDKLDGRPLIYASLGTLVNGRYSIIRAILGAVGRLSEFQVVFSVGKNASLDELGPIPSNTIVVPVAPQLELLERAALCITHAGLNTTLEALGRGVPLVAIPIGYDQPGVAARIAHHRVGEFIEVRDLTAVGLSGLIRKVLDDPSYSDRARSLRDAIAAADGLNTACDLIERAFGVRA